MRIALDGDEAAPAALVGVEGGHEALLLGSILQPAPRPCLVQRQRLEAKFDTAFYDRSFGCRASRFEAFAGILVGHLAAQRRDLEEAAQRSRRCGVHDLWPSRAGAALGVAQVQAVELHAVLGQRAGLVEAEDLQRAEALDRLQAPHDDALAPQLAQSQSKRRRCCRRQALRHGGNRKGERAVEHGEPRAPAQIADDKECAAGAERHQCELGTQIVEIALERRARRRHLMRRCVDAACLRIGAGGDDDGAPGAIDDE